MFKRLALAIKILLHGPQQKPVNDRTLDSLDPLIPLARLRRGNVSLEDQREFKMRSAFDDVVRDERAHVKKLVGDSAALRKIYVGDDGSGGLKAQQGFYGMPESLQAWYISQGFIGWQACAIIAQQWLVNKACSQSGLDAVRHGWEIKVADKKQTGHAGPDADDIDESILDRIKEIDEDFGIKKHCSDLAKFTNIFGIRVCIFDIEYDDPKAYEKPFNIDAVRKGKYRGIRQVDPYWCAPMLDTEAAADPTSLRFYKPTWWTIGGRRYHWTHLHIGMGPEVSDILKPQYYYGGVPLTQRIYERIYAAERTANEAPLLSMSKRTTALHVDLKKMAANQAAFEDRMANWIEYRDNHGVKILGLEESMEESDTSLSDFDSVIMNQYQLVAAISETPATKLLGTSPKGFNATGEFEEKSYHEKLETIQSDEYGPLLARHYELLVRSEGWDFRVEISWNPTDAKTAEKQADINDKKAATGERLINAGVISPDEERDRIRNDKNSGYTLLGDEDADQQFLEPGELDKPGSEEKGQAALAGASKQLGKDEGIEGEYIPASPELVQLGALTEKLALALQKKREAGRKPKKLGPIAPSTVGLKPSTIAAIKSPVKGDVGKMNETDLPKASWAGYRVAIENPAGTYRSGQDESGKQWSNRMQHDYGYLMGTVGADGDGVDVFMGRSKDASHVYVVNQNKEDGTFDEHKVFIGFGSEPDAKAAYNGAFDQDWKGFGDIHPVLVSDFKRWLGEGDLTKPYSQDWHIAEHTEQVVNQNTGVNNGQ